MKRVAMIAAKPMRYQTRRLRAGDAFHATRSEAVVYRAVGLASDAATVPAKPATKPAEKVLSRQAVPDERDGSGWATYKPGPVVDAAAVEVDRLRSEYEFLTGQKADRRWGADRLRGELADVGSSGGGAPDNGEASQG